ncbi:MAG: hypothetical protein E7327_07595 [Clostridiales bacterium]|nr:hypothetical protein [Clostridiales bacterium]
MKMTAMLLCCLLLGGCTALPAEERSFAVVLGVDREGEEWAVHARIPTYQTGGGYATVSGTGQTLEEALLRVDAAAPMQLHFGQLRLLVFTAALARTEDLAIALDVLTQRHDLRLDASTAVTDAALPDLMEAMKPQSGSRLSKSLDVLIQTRIEQGTALPAALGDVLRMGERQSPVLMRLTLEAGAAELDGCWPLSADWVVTEPLSRDETQLLSLMLGQMKSGALSLSEGTVRLTAAKAETELHLPTMQQAAVRLTLRCTSSALTEEALSQAAATACLGVLNRLSGMGCDALGLARQAIVHARTMADWHDMDWPARYQDIHWSVSVGVEGPS